MYNLIEYGDNYSKTSEGLKLYFKDEPASVDNDCCSFTDYNITDLLNFKEKITNQTGNNGTKNI